MYFKILKLIIILLLSYQTPVFSKSNSLNDFDRKDLSNYFSGIVAFENKNISEAYNFFKSSKDLLDDHDPFLKRYVDSMILDNNVAQAINIIKKNETKDNSKFFEAYILLALDSLKKNDFDQADSYLNKSLSTASNDSFKLVIFETLKKYVYVFKEGKIQSQKKNYGNLTYISEIFQRCYLNDDKIGAFFHLRKTLAIKQIRCFGRQGQNADMDITAVQQIFKPLAAMGRFYRLWELAFTA